MASQSRKGLAASLRVSSLAGAIAATLSVPCVAQQSAHRVSVIRIGTPVAAVLSSPLCLDSLPVGHIIDVVLRVAAGGAMRSPGNPTYLTGSLRRMETNGAGRRADTAFALEEVTDNATPQRALFGMLRFPSRRSAGLQHSPHPNCHGEGEELIGLLAKAIAFMPPAPSVTRRVPALPPDSVPAIVRDSSLFVRLADAAFDVRVHRSVLLVEFEESTPGSARAAIIATIGGRVIGGEPSGLGGDGPYYVRVPDDPTGERNLRVTDSTGDRQNSLEYVLGPPGAAAYSYEQGQPTERIWTVTAAFPMRGDSALIVVNRMRATSRVYTDYNCYPLNLKLAPSMMVASREHGPSAAGAGDRLDCNFTEYVWRPDRAFLYTMNIRDQVPGFRLQRELPDTMVYAVGFAEDDSATVVTFGSEIRTENGSGTKTEQQWCTIAYLDARLRGTPIGPVSVASGCLPLGSDGGGAAATMGRGAVGGAWLRPDRTPMPRLPKPSGAERGTVRREPR